MVNIKEVKEATKGHYEERLKFLEENFGITEEDIINTDENHKNVQLDKHDNFEITVLYQPENARVNSGASNDPYYPKYFNMKIKDKEKNTIYYFNFLNKVLTEYHDENGIKFEYNWIDKKNKFCESKKTKIYVTDIVNNVLGISCKDDLYLNNNKLTLQSGDMGVFPPKGFNATSNYPLKNTYFIKSDYELKVEPVDKDKDFLTFKDGKKIYPLNNIVDSDMNKDTNYSLITDTTENQLEERNISLDNKKNNEVQNESESKSYSDYNKEDFLSEIYMNVEEYGNLINVLSYKKNLLLQGAPGVGKTFLAERLAYVMIGQKNYDRILKVQFHQNYSYEEFICGYKAIEDGFGLKTGIFYDFCKEAEKDPDNEYFFIIDEINRGNLSKIFGEVFMLIESDKRGANVQLMYNNESFSIPKNLYIIGTMNTADRSIAMIDYALRRRFTFYTLNPAFDSDQFKEYIENLHSTEFKNIINLIKDLNDEISNDELLGEDYNIGHSYFCNLDKNNLKKELKTIIEYEIIPLIKEYWFDNKDKFEEWSDKLRSVLDDKN